MLQSDEFACDTHELLRVFFDLDIANTNGTQNIVIDDCFDDLRATSNEHV